VLELGINLSETYFSEPRGEKINLTAKKISSFFRQKTISDNFEILFKFLVV
jgi:hypothetical protein